MKIPVQMLILTATGGCGDAPQGRSGKGGGAGGTDVPVDADGDGYGADDCADWDATVHPGADERCNGYDDDCDGEIDEGAVDPVPTFRDEDRDGYGAGEAVLQCPHGLWVTADGDCDDADTRLHPGAVETCDGIDEDCDGRVDIGPRYVDADGDGHGAPDSAFDAEICDAPAPGESDTDDDCDDSEARRNPSAEDVCGGPIDEDCDGVVSHCVWATWSREGETCSLTATRDIRIGIADYWRVCPDCDFDLIAEYWDLTLEGSAACHGAPETAYLHIWHVSGSVSHGVSFYGPGGSSHVGTSSTAPLLWTGHSVGAQEQWLELDLTDGTVLQDVAAGFELDRGGFSYYYDE